MPIEDAFDVSFIAALALREKQIQQHYRPIIAVHKWFARRPGTLFRGLLMSEFVDGSLREAYFKGHDLEGITVADPFMGGGTPLIEANRLGCDVVGYDINPMAYWIVREEIGHLDLDAYRQAAAKLVAQLRREIGDYYTTRCDVCGSSTAQVKYFLWVKQQVCDHCGEQVDLFPGGLVAENRRHPKHVLLCFACGDLNEVASIKEPGRCASCSAEFQLDGPAKRSRYVCPHCDHVGRYPSGDAPPEHRMFAIEYHCDHCKAGHKGRFFKRPEKKDLANYQACVDKLKRARPRFIPDAEIDPGDETNRLLRWGYRRYREMFNSRQLLGLELSARLIRKTQDERLRGALATNLSDLLRYQNMLCRYDTMALKSLDIFSIHGFPVGLVQCESNILGIASPTGVCIGSGGWGNIISKYAKAKTFCDEPFEVRVSGSRKVRVPIHGEWIGESRNGCRSRMVQIRCADASAERLRPNSLDGVFTDPPYFGNVQYGELMEFCFIWLRKLVDGDDPVFERASVRNPSELTGNATMDRGLEHFTDGLSRTFQHMARALKPNRPLAFTYHHNQLEAYFPVAVAILDAGLNCTAVLPCPAEMGGSIHISGTKSSIVDSVFVCRKQAIERSESIPTSPQELAHVVRLDLAKLLAAGHRATDGDANCIANGHIIRSAISGLQATWDHSAAVATKLDTLAEAVHTLASPAEIRDGIRDAGPLKSTDEMPLFDEIEVPAS